MNARSVYAGLTGADAANVAADEPRNALIHVAALTLTRTADRLIDPKLVLAWLLTTLGAPGAFIGALVPVREAGALLPQLALARLVEASRRRKLFWSAGAALQGLAALGIAAAALTLQGAAAGAAIVALLALLSVARAAASLSQKDALARTIPKRRRGAVTGVAGALAPAAVIAVGAAMAAGLFDRAVPSLAALVAAGGCAFLLAAAVFMRLSEPSKAPEGDGEGGLAALVRPILEDGQLRVLVAARAALTVTALAPPFIVMASSAAGGGALDQLGPLVVASTAASIAASYVWGRLSDRSSRRTLMAAGALAAAAYAAIGGVGLQTGGLGGPLGAAAAIFVAQIAYEGVRTGRKLHLTDMAEDGFRARYTALSNTLVGVVLVAGGLFGAAADAYGAAAVILGFAVIAALGAAIAASLDEVQGEG